MSPRQPIPEPDAEPAAASEVPPSLEALLEGVELPVPELDLPPPGAGCVLGECVDDRHPSLRGRVRVCWREPGGAVVERWLPTLQGLPVRTGDRVVLLRPANVDEPIVTGVVDGFSARPKVQRRAAAQVELRRDEGVRILASTGEALVEIREGDSGPVLELLHPDLELATPGRLRLRAQRVEVAAERGPVEIEASDDVVVRGEIIRLN